jgi:hypothetical protein
MTPFDFVNIVLHDRNKKSKEDLDFDEYKPFLINRSLSYQFDCILYVNELNMHHNIPKTLQYQYLLNTIRPMKRKFQAWQKQAVIKDLEYVKEYFGYSDEKAKDALRILTDQQIALIKEKLEKGGVKK